MMDPAELMAVLGEMIGLIGRPDADIAWSGQELDERSRRCDGMETNSLSRYVQRIARPHGT